MINNSRKADEAKVLYDSDYHFEALDISNYKAEILSILLYKLVYLRKVELKVAEARKSGLIGGPVHLAIGQEAIPVAVSSFLTESDAVYGAHRSHGHILSMGCNLNSFFAELLGRSDGLCRGIGGSMHLWDESVGFYGSVPIVGGTISLAVGAGLAFKLQKKASLAVAYLGDGAVEEGVFHESLNFAKTMGCKILFVIENNLFASHMHISLRQPSANISRFAIANNIPSTCVDGNDILSMQKAVKLAVNLIRQENVPYLIEAVTYRHFGHVDWREDIDVGVNRSQVDIDAWKKRDPIERLKSAMLEVKLITDNGYSDMVHGIENKIQAAFTYALSRPYSSSSDEFLWSRKLMR